MANYKRQEPMFTKSYKIRTSFTPNLNRNPINSMRPSVDYSDIDFDSIAVHPQQKDEEDTVNPINDAKRRPVFDRLGHMPTNSLSQRIGLTTTNQPITDVQEISNNLQDKYINIKTRSESNVALIATKTNHKIDNKIKLQQKDEEDTVNSINVAKRRPVFDRLGHMPTKSLSQRIRLTTTNQSITDVQEISNDLQDKDINIKTRPESNVALIATKSNHKIDNIIKPQQKEEEDTVNPINDAKRRPVFDRLGHMPSNLLSQRTGLTTTNQPKTDVQEISNDLQDKDINIRTRPELNVALIATKTNHKIDNKIKPQQKEEEDTVNPINDAKRQPVFDCLGHMPSNLLSQRIGLTSSNQPITDVQEISNDLQDKDINIKTRPELNVTLKTTKRNHKIDNKIIHLDEPKEKLPSLEKKIESRKRKNTSRPHSTESKNRKKIRISNIKKHGESNNKYQHNAHDHNDISIDTQLIGRTRTPERSRSQNNRSRKFHFSPKRPEGSYSSKDKTEHRNTKRKHEKGDSRHEITEHGKCLQDCKKPCTITIQNDDTYSNALYQSTHSSNVNKRRNCEDRYKSCSDVKSRGQNTGQNYNGITTFTNKSQNEYDASDQRIDITKLSKMATDRLTAYLSICSRELDTFLLKHAVIDQMELFLQVMCQVCESKHHSLVQKALSPLKERRFFERQDTKDIICQLCLQFDKEQIHMLKNLLVLIKGLVCHVNSQLSDLMQPFGSLERCVREKVNDRNQQRDLESLIQEIRDKSDHPEKTPNIENKLSTLPILPDLMDIESCENTIIDSDFSTEESYLRRLFMVHRQDFIRPLCRGLISLKNSLRVDQFCLEKKWRHDDIRVYKNICFLTQCCNEYNGITWIIRLDTPKSSRSRKLLKSGSLVCLTNKTFTILQYATVEDNNDRNLRNGIYEIKFIDDIPNMFELLHEHNVILIDSQTFFPSYFHTLLSIKCMYNMIINEENSLPFGTQLSNKRNSLNPEEPDYFKSPSFIKDGFDISCLNQVHDVKKIDISNDANWPDAKTIGMDDSQHRALITSMKIKLALIQGPPGTGKTVIGLKIAELLLSNEHLWREQDNQGPMLLLSYTNHALDQFLVEISERFMENDDADIVRLGSGSEIDILKKYNITGKRKAYTYKKESFTTRGGKIRTRTLRENTGEHNVMALYAKKDLKNIIKELEYLQKVRREVQTGIVHQDWLRYSVNVITDTQCKEFRKTDSLIRWLEIESIALHVVTTQNNYCKAINGDYDLELNDKTYLFNNRGRRDGEEDIESTGKIPTMHLENLKMVFSSDIIFTNEKIKEKLHHTEQLTTEEANLVSNLWCMNKAQRWQLYKYWVQLSLLPLNEKIQKYEDRYKAAQQLYIKKQQEADIIILKKARLIACTTTRAARDKDILKKVYPSIFLIEEAAEIPEHHVVACLTSSCRQLIMIGDHQQLRPSYNDYKTVQEHKINISLFERLIDEGFPSTQLEYQHRMRPSISKLLVPHIYENLKNDKNVSGYENVKGIHCDMFLMSHSEFEDKNHNTISKSHKNKFEAMFICELYRYLRIQGYESSEITVLSTYLDQVRLLRDSIGKVDEELSRKNAWFSREQSVRVETVDNFQGEENEIILLSLVRSNRKQNIGYLSEDNRVCVALSRAKIGFYAIGNFEILKAKSELWNSIVSDATKSKYIGNRLQLTCQTHGTSTYVSKPEDFKSVTDGGCHKTCYVKKQCGHICLRKCHVDDHDNESHCRKQCQKVCEMGHKCTKPCHFSDSCERCNIFVEKTIPKCRHVKRMPCHKDPIFEPCGQRCPTCRDPCSTEDTCKGKIQVKARCGHEVQVECSTKYDASCKLPCSGILDCGHKCKGTHSECSQGRLHVPCKANCERNLVYEHDHKDYCSYRRSSCMHDDTCKARCDGSELCKGECKAECPNKFKCDKLCTEPCKRPKCNTLCKTRLECGPDHTCSGLFCECVQCICQICDRLTIIPVEDERVEHAVFIRLEDCKCVVEVNVLDKHILSVMNNNHDEIKSLKCPKCATIILKSRRYRKELKIINECMKDKFLNIRKIEESTYLQAKRFATRQLLTEYKTDIPRNIFTKLWNQVKSTRSIDILNMVIDQLTFYEEIFSLRIEKFPSDRLYQAWLNRLEKWVFLRRSKYSRQEHNEFYLEIRRLQLILDIHTFKTELKARDKGLILPDIIEKYLLKLESIEIIKENEFSKMRKETEDVSSRMIGLALKERQMIKRAMDNESMGSGR